MKKQSMSFGQAMNFKPPHPERTARSEGRSWDSPVVYQEWPNRESMARSIRMQQSRAPSPADWKACVKLSDGEGY